MNYFEYPPSFRLSPYIKTYWFLEGILSLQDIQPERIFPDGCMELIIHYGDAFQKLAKNNTEKQSTGFVYGQLEEYIELLPGPVTGVMGVQFYPHGLAHFTTLPVYEIKQQAVELLHIFKKEGRQLAEAIGAASNVAERVNIMEKILINNLIEQKRNTGLAQALVKDIYNAKGCISMNRLVQKYHTTERQLERVFNTEVGLSPKNFSCIVRFQQVFKLAPTAISLTTLAHDAGYFDQAHFSREFKAFTGFSPRQFFNGRYMFTTFFVNE